MNQAFFNFDGQPGLFDPSTVGMCVNPCGSLEANPSLVLQDGPAPDIMPLKDQTKKEAEEDPEDSQGLRYYNIFWLAVGIFSLASLLLRKNPS